jgi:hypothetical protein
MFLACVAGLGVSAPAAAQERWARYRNARFGTTIAYQEFFEPGDEPANGDGRAFTSPEAEFRVFGRYNVAGETPQSLLADIKVDPGHLGLSYQAITGRRLTVSGRHGDRIFYEVYLCAPSGVVHTFQLDYPAAHKAEYDDMVTRMARSFGGP